MALQGAPIGQFAPPDVADGIDQQMQAQRAQNQFTSAVSDHAATLDQQALQDRLDTAKTKFQAGLAAPSLPPLEDVMGQAQDQYLAGLSAQMDQAGKPNARIAQPQPEPKATSTATAATGGGLPAPGSSEQAVTQATNTATQAALNAGAPPANLLKAKQMLADDPQAYINWCEKFVENAEGKTGQFPTAQAAADHYQGQGQLRQDFENAKPGDKVYYGAHPENNGAGHAALLNDANTVVSSASAQPTPLSGYFKGPLLGYVSQAPGTFAEQTGGGLQDYLDQTVPMPPVANVASDAPVSAPASSTPESIPPPEDQSSSATPPATTDQPLPAEQPAGEPAPGAPVAASSDQGTPAWLNPASVDTSQPLAVQTPEGLQPVNPQPAQAPQTDVKAMLSQALHDVADKIGGAANTAANTSLEDVQQGLKTVASKPLGALENVALAQAPLTDEQKQSVRDVVEPAVSNVAESGFDQARQNLDAIQNASTDPDAANNAVSNILVAGMSGGSPGAKAASVVSPTVAAENPGILGKIASAVNDLLAPIKNTAPEVQDAVANFAGKRLESQVRADTVRLEGKTLGPANEDVAALIAREKGDLSALTPEQRAIVSKWDQFNQETGEAGRYLGFIKGDVTAGADGVAQYVPHIYLQDDVKAADQAARKSGLSPSGFYSNGRTLKDFESAIAAGKTPAPMAEGQAIYTQRVLDSQAKAELLTDLQTADGVIRMPEDIRTLPDGYKPLVPSDPILRGWAAPEAVAKVIDNIVSPSALRQNAITRGLMDVQSGAKMGLFSASNFHLMTELRQAYRLNGTDAGEAIGKGIWNAVNPKAWGNFRLNNADAFADTARAGVTGLSAGLGPDVAATSTSKLMRGASAAVGGVESGVAGYLSAKAQGQDDQDAIKRGLAFGAAGAAGGAVIAPALTKALWERVVPTLKVVGFQSLKEAGVPAAQAATEVNTTFGGQNLEAVARSKTVQDILRLGILAPDWWEGWARQFGTAFKGSGGSVRGSLPFGNPRSGGDAARAYWVRTATEAAFMTEGLNYLFNGHFSNDNDEGHKAELELTGLYQKLGAGDALTHTDRGNVVPDQHRVYADVLGPIRSVVQSTIDASPGEFAGSHVGMIPSTVMGVKDAADREFKQSGDRGASALAGTEAGLQRLAPIGFQQAAQSQQPWQAQAASFATGTKLGEVSGGQEIQKALDGVISQVGGQKVWNALPSAKRVALMKAVGITTNPYSEKVREANSKINRVQTLQGLRSGH